MRNLFLFAAVRGAAAVEKPDGGLAVVDFDPTTLQIKS
jgi:hypothetical protein